MPHPGDRRVSRWLLMVGAGLCALVVAVTVAGIAGGFDPVPAEELPVVAEDELNEGEPWNVTVDGAVLAADLEPAVLQEDGYWLVVVADVEITADESRQDVRDILCVRDVVGLAREPASSVGCPDGVAVDDIRLVRDTSAVRALHPGVPERVAFLWELAIDTPPPAEVQVEIVSKTYREVGLTGRLEWFDEQPRARVTLPVDDRRDER